MKKSIRLSVFTVSVLLSQVVNAHGWGKFDLYKEVELSLSTADLSKLTVDVAAGDLEIVGQQGLSHITLTAKVYGEDIEDTDYQLSLKKDGDQATLEARFLNDTYNNEHIDLMVSIPASLALQVDDRSGDIKVEGVHAGLELYDRSGDIELTDIAGKIVINDRSGDIEAKRLNGDVSINDRSGDIVVKKVDGDLSIDDSSGDIRAKDVSGVVTVGDSSGDINVTSANDFVLKSDSSGDVHLKNIQSAR